MSRMPLHAPGRKDCRGPEHGDYCWGWPEFPPRSLSEEGPTLWPHPVLAESSYKLEPGAAGGATLTLVGLGSCIRGTGSTHAAGPAALDLSKDLSSSQISQQCNSSTSLHLGEPPFCHLEIMRIVSTWNGCWGDCKRWL